MQFYKSIKAPRPLFRNPTAKVRADILPFPIKSTGGRTASVPWLALCVFVTCLLGESYAATVTYTMGDTSYYTQFVGGSAGMFGRDGGTTELGMFANGASAPKEVVGWRNFKTAGNNSGSDRSLQVGDVFTITADATAAFGGIGFSLNDNGTQGSSYGNRTSGSRLFVQEVGTTASWEVNSASGSGGYTSLDYNVSSTRRNYTFKVYITSETTANVLLSVDGTDKRAYNLNLNGSAGANIDAFSIWLKDDWNGSSNQNIYWKGTSVEDLGQVEVGYYLASGATTDPGKIADGLAANSTSTTRANNVLVGGDSGSAVLLNQENTYTGATTVNANATARASHANAFGTTAGGVSVTSGGAIELSGGTAIGAETLTLNGTGISSAGALRNTSGNNSWAGAITLGSNARINSDQDTLTLDVASGNAVSGSDLNITFGGAGNVSVADAISLGTGTLTKDGNGILTLSAANSYSGTTTLSAGTLRGGNDGAFGAGSLILNGGTIASGSSDGRTFANNLTIGGNVIFGDATGTGALTFSSTATNALGGTRQLTTSVNTSIAGAIGGGGITKAGNAQLTLTSDNSSFSTLAINAGSVAINGNTTVTGLDGSSGSMSIASGKRLTVNGGSDSSFGLAIGGSGGLTKAGSAILTLSGNNTYTGGTIIQQGTIRISADSNLGGDPGSPTAGSITMSNTTGNLGALVATETFALDSDRGLQLVGSPSGGQSSYFVAVASGKTLTYNGAITGAGNLVQNQAGTLKLGGTSSSYNGGIYIDAGTVEFSSGSIGSSSESTFLGIGKDASSDAAAFTISGASLTTTRNIEVRSGGGTRKINYTHVSGTSTLAGNLTLSNSLAFDVASGGTLQFEGIVTPQASGNVRIALDGGGTLISTGNSTTTAANYQIRVGDGTLILGNGALTARTGVGGIGHAYDLGVDLDNNPVDATASILASNNVSVVSSIYVSTTGTAARILGLTGSGEAEFSGAVDLYNAGLTVTADNAAGNAIFSGVIGNWNDSTPANNTLTKTGAGTATLSGNNTFGGGSTLAAGTLKVSHINALGTGSLSQSNGSSLLEIAVAGTVTNDMSVYNIIYTAGSTLSGDLTLNNTTFDVTNGVTSTNTGVLSGLGGVTKIGAGTLILAGSVNNTYEGATIISNGGLVLSNSGGNAIHASSSITVDGASSQLVLGASNQIGDGIGLVLDGGTFIVGNSTAGYAEDLGTLTLSSNSTIDFGSNTTNRSLTFDASNLIGWSGILTITNWVQAGNGTNGAYGQLFFGNSSSGLTSGQLGQISFDINGSLYGAKILSSGEVVADITPIPEPRVYSGALALIVAVGWRERKRLIGLVRRKSPRA